MGYDLYNANKCFCFSESAWIHVLILAQRFGWKPMGTIITEESAKMIMGKMSSNEEAVQDYIKGWEGNYIGNDFQLVVKEDALNLAHALMKAMEVMEVLPDEENVLDFLSTKDCFSSKGWKNRINEFILFCETGEFDIT